MLAGFILSGQNSGLEAFESSQLPMPRYQITQETSNQNGVLVSRPRTVDLDILNIIRLNHIQTLDDYERWLKTNIRYTKNISKNSQYQPEETLRTKDGDCKNFTFLNMAVVKIIGYEPKFLALTRRGGSSHAICVFKENDHFSWFDNAKLNRSAARSLEELSQSLAQTYGYSAVHQLNSANNSWQLVYQGT